jgi:hypothetical protein
LRYQKICKTEIKKFLFRQFFATKTKTQYKVIYTELKPTFSPTIPNTTLYNYPKINRAKTPKPQQLPKNFSFQNPKRQKKLPQAIITQTRRLLSTSAPAKKGSHESPTSLFRLGCSL